MRISRAIAILAIAVIPSTAHAGGSISLEDVIPQVAGHSPKLMKEISSALLARDMKVADVICDGLRLGRHYKHLGGARVPTYTCKFADKTLELNASVTFYDASATPTDNPASAQFIGLTTPQWTWK